MATLPDRYERFLTAGHRGFYESHYLKANSPDGRHGIWIKHNLLLPLTGDPIAELWLVWSERGERPRVFKREVLLDRVRVASDRVELRGGGFELDPHRARGEIADASWDLALSGGLPPLFHLAHPILYTASFPKKKILTPAPNLTFDGTLRLGGEAVSVKGWKGLRGHNWGREHAHAYAYGNCNLWDDGAEDRAVDGFTAKIKLGPLTSPWLSVALYTEERRIVPDNAVLTWANPRAEVTPGRWRLPGRKVDITMEADPATYAGLRYRHPDGRVSYCYNTKFATVRVTVAGQTHTSKCGELEMLTPAPLASVPLHPSEGWTGQSDYSG
jgi:hypothetical protein